MKTVQVFVYGTLLRGERNHFVAERFIQAAKPGAVAGRLYNVGSFPALVLNPEDPENGVVIGEWFTVAEEGLLNMDRLEGFRPERPAHANHYQRVEVVDIDSGEQGWVYVYQDSSGLPEIKNGSWVHRNDPHFAGRRTAAM